MQHTPISIIAEVSRVVSVSVDQLTGDRVNYPLLVAYGVSEALSLYEIKSRIMYGEAAWVEILGDHRAVWSGCWDGNLHVWCETEFREIVDLNTSAAKRKAPHKAPDQKSLYCPPMIWSIDLPSFVKYKPEGVAELEIHDEQGKAWMKALKEKITDKCSALSALSHEDEPWNFEFANEPILCPNKQLLDDSEQNFQFFDRALSIAGIPTSPI